MRKIIIGLVAALTIGAPIALAAPASADPGSPKCMTQAEWRKIKPGMTRVQVNRIVGITGKTTWFYFDGNGWLRQWDVSYRQCFPKGKPAGSVVTVYFDNFTTDANGVDHPAPSGVDGRGGWTRPYR